MTQFASSSPLRLRSRTRRRAYISLTPLIDVVFILLIFFMLASSFLDWRSIDLQAPASAGQGGGETGALLLRVHPDGRLDLNGRAVTPGALTPRLQEALQRKETARLLIRPAAGVPMQRAVDLLDRARDAGIQKVQLIRGAEARR